MLYPICSVVAVLKMLVRILNTLRSRIWDRALFLFSDYLNPQLVRMGIAQRFMVFIRMNISRKGYFLTRLYKNYIRCQMTPTLWGIFSLVNSHNLLASPLLFPTEITNLLFVIKNRQPLKQNFMLNCKNTMIKKKEWL